MRIKILGAILFAVPSAVLLTAQANGGEPAGCSAKPGLSTPAGRHWYYRINHVGRRHCWYLGKEGLRVRAHRPVLSESTSSAQTERRTSATEPAVLPAQTAPAIASPAALMAAPPPDSGGEPIAFAARWPEPPAAPNVDGSNLTTVRASYADADAANDATPQMPAQWQVFEAAPGRADAPKETPEAGLQSLPLAGPLGIALLLLAGASLNLALAPWRSRLRRIWRAIVTPRQPRPRLRSMPARAVAQPTGGERSRRPPTLTDPALDLKQSLRELMRDLQRAGLDCEPPRSFAPAVAASRNHAHRPMRSRPLSTRLAGLQRYSPPGRTGYATRRG